MSDIPTDLFLKNEFDRRSARRAAEYAWDAVTVRWPRKAWRFVVRSWRELASQEVSLQRRVAKLEANRRAQLNVLTTAPPSQLRTEALDILRLVEPLLNARPMALDEPEVATVGATVGQGKKATGISSRAEDRPPSPDTEPEEVWEEEEEEQGSFSLEGDDELVAAASKREAGSPAEAANFESVAAAASEAAELAAKEEAAAAEAAQREKREAQERLQRLKEAERIEQAQRAQAAATAAAEARAQAAETKLAAAEARLQQQAQDAAAASAAAASAAADAAATAITAVSAPASAAAVSTSAPVAQAPRAVLPFSATVLTAAKGTLKVAASKESSESGEPSEDAAHSSRPAVDPAALMAGARGLKKRPTADEESAPAASPSKGKVTRQTSGADSAADSRASTRSGSVISASILNDAKAKLGSRQTRGSAAASSSAAPKAKSSSLAQSDSTTTMLRQAIDKKRLRAHVSAYISKKCLRMLDDYSILCCDT